MNATETEFMAPAVVGETMSAMAVMTSDNQMERMIRFGELMSSASIAVPAHLRGKAGDCLAVIMQSMQWGMNPFAVAQKTHVVNGALGYEAQLVNAVVQASGAINGHFHYEYQGDGQNTSCRVGAVLRGESEITWGEWLNANTVTTKNSPLWKTNIKQQLGYLQVKNWARAFAPGAILGVYTPDELDAAAPGEKEINPINGTTTNEKPAIEFYPQKLFDENLPKWTQLILKKKKTADEIIATVESKNPLTDEQKEAINSVGVPEVKPSAPEVSFAQVADKLNKAEDVDLLAVAADLIGEVSDEQQRKELGELYKSRLAELGE